LNRVQKYATGKLAVQRMLTEVRERYILITKDSKMLFKQIKLTWYSLRYWHEGNQHHSPVGLSPATKKVAKVDEP